MEELNEGTCSDGWEDDDCPTPSIDTPCKLRSQIRKAKEKTEINQLVHFELLSYGYEEQKQEDAESSDSDIDIMERNGQSPALKVKKAVSQGKAYEKAPFPEIMNATRTRSMRKSTFLKNEIKEVDFEDSDSASLVLDHRNNSKFSSKKKSTFATHTEIEKDSPGQIPSSDSLSRAFDTENCLDSESSFPTRQDLTAEKSDSMSLHKKGRSTSLVLAFQSKVSKMIEGERQDELQSNDNLDTAATKSPVQTTEKETFPTDDHKQLSFNNSQNTPFGSGPHRILRLRAR